MTVEVANTIGVNNIPRDLRVIPIQWGGNTSPQGREAHTWLAN